MNKKNIIKLTILVLIITCLSIFSYILVNADDTVLSGYNGYTGGGTTAGSKQWGIIEDITRYKLFVDGVYVAYKDIANKNNDAGVFKAYNWSQIKGTDIYSNPVFPIDITKNDVVENVGSFTFFDGYDSSVIKSNINDEKSSYQIIVEPIYNYTQHEVTTSEIQSGWTEVWRLYNYMSGTQGLPNSNSSATDWLTNVYKGYGPQFIRNRIAMTGSYKGNRIYEENYTLYPQQYDAVGKHNKWWGGISGTTILNYEVTVKYCYYDSSTETTTEFFSESYDSIKGSDFSKSFESYTDSYETSGRLYLYKTFYRESDGQNKNVLTISTNSDLIQNFTVEDNTTVYAYYIKDPRIKVTVHYVEDIGNHDSYSSSCLTEDSISIKTSDVYYFEKNSSDVSIDLPKNIGEHTLSASYLKSTSGIISYHSDSNVTKRNPGRLSRDLEIIAEYGKSKPTVNVTVYYVKSIEEHGEYDSESCLNETSTAIEEADVYTFEKGKNAIIDLPITLDDGKYTLSASYLKYASGTISYHSDSSVTTRNLGSLSSDLKIIAEYGESADKIQETTITDKECNARGLIASETKGNRTYDVYKGIPTGKNVYAQTKANKYLFDVTLGKVIGSRTYTSTVNVTYNFKYYCDGSSCNHLVGASICGGHTKERLKTFTYTVNRPFSYWKINNYEIFRMNSMYIHNDVVGGITWNNSTNSVSIVKNILDNHLELASNGTVNIETNIAVPGITNSIDTFINSYDFNIKKNEYKQNAENGINNIKVKNDKLIVEDDVILKDNSWEEKNGTTPNFNKQVDIGIEYEKRNIQIPITYKNGRSVTNESSIRYVSQEVFNKTKSSDIKVNIKGFSSNNLSNNINNTPNLDLVNDIIIHTPLYIDGNISGVDTNDLQKINHNTTEIVLDKDFTVNFNVKGTHREILGYGNRSYKDYIKTNNEGNKEIEIKSPFDLYIKKGENDYDFLGANTWYNVSSYMNGDTGNITFKLPVWTNEGNYSGINTIVLRVIGVNDQYSDDRDTLGIFKSNFDKDGYGRESSSFITSLNNTSVYSRAYYSIPIDVVGRVYDFKLEYIDDTSFGDLSNMGFQSRDISKLPFPQKGDNIYNKYYTYAAKLGYKFKYTLKTKGEKSNEIEIIPHFYYVSKLGTSGLQEVDVYYQNSKGNVEKLDTNSTLKLTTNLTKAGELPYIDGTLIENTRRITGYNGFNNTIGIGTVGKVLLDSRARLRYDNIDNYQAFYTDNNLTGNVPADDIIASNSIWYGEYKLPSTSVFVEKDKNANEKIIEDGYVIVYFDIKTKYNDGVNSYDYLSYQLPNSNTQWQKEGWVEKRIIKLPNGKEVLDREVSTDYSSIFIYEAKLNNGRDVVVTH